MGELVKACCPACPSLSSPVTPASGGALKEALLPSAAAHVRDPSTPPLTPPVVVLECQPPDTRPSPGV